VDEGLRLSLWEAVAVRLDVTLLVMLCVAEPVAVRVAVREPEGLAVAERELLDEGVPV